MSSRSQSPTWYSISRPSFVARSRAVSISAAQIDAGHPGSSCGSAFGDRAGAAREVEPALARAGIDPVDHRLVDVRDRLGDALVRACAPDHALLPLQLFVGHG